jgi:hypothetical protein
MNSCLLTQCKNEAEFFKELSAVFRIKVYAKYKMKYEKWILWTGVGLDLFSIFMRYFHPARIDHLI